MHRLTATLVQGSAPSRHRRRRRVGLRLGRLGGLLPLGHRATGGRRGAVAGPQVEVRPPRIARRSRPSLRPRLWVVAGRWCWHQTTLPMWWASRARRIAARRTPVAMGGRSPWSDRRNLATGRRASMPGQGTLETAAGFGYALCTSSRRTSGRTRPRGVCLRAAASERAGQMRCRTSRGPTRASVTSTAGFCACWHNRAISEPDVRREEPSASTHGPICSVESVRRVVALSTMRRCGAGAVASSPVKDQQHALLIRRKEHLEIRAD